MIWLAIAGGICTLYFSYRYGWWLPTVSYCKPRILMYHMVNNHKQGQKFKGLRVPPSMFEKQLAYMDKHDWRFYTVSELMELDTPPPKSVAITFDDGYADNFTHAFPILKKHNAKATLYLVVDRHNRDWSTSKKAHHNNGELAAEPKLTDNQVNEMLASGLVELGAHTLTHANLAAMNKEQKSAEIGASKTALEQTFKTRVKSFAYPFGIYNQEDAELVKATGFTSAVTTIDGIEALDKANPFELKRVKISGKDNFLAFKIRLKIGKRGWKK